MKYLLTSNTLINNYLLITFITLIFSETFIIDSTILPLGLIIFFLSINIQKIKLSNFQIISFITFIVYFASYLAISKNFFSVLINMKFFFGFLIFLIFLKTININKDFIKILRIVLIVSYVYAFFDAVMINLFEMTFLHQEVHTAKFFGFYTRPPGIAGNSTISSLYILINFLILKKIYLIKFSKLEFSLIISSIFILFSSAGFISLLAIIFFIIYDPKKINFYINFIFYSMLLLLFLALSLFIDPDIAQKLSLKYILYVLDEKWFFVKHVLMSQEIIITKHSDLIFADKFLTLYTQGNCFDAFYGCQSSKYYPMTSGDSGFLGLIVTTGYLGLIVFLLIFVSFLNISKKNILYSFFILLISFHYGFIFFSFGQFLFALILSKNLNITINDK